MPFYLTDMAKGAEAMTGIMNSSDWRVADQAKAQAMPQIIQLQMKEMQQQQQIRGQELQKLLQENQANESIKPELAKLANSPEYQNSPASKKSEMLANIYMKSGLIDKAEKAEAASAQAEWRESQARVNELKGIQDKVEGFIDAAKGVSSDEDILNLASKMKDPSVQMRIAGLAQMARNGVPIDQLKKQLDEFALTAKERVQEALRREAEHEKELHDERMENARISAVEKQYRHEAQAKENQTTREVDSRYKTHLSRMDNFQKRYDKAETTQAKTDIVEQMETEKSDYQDFIVSRGRGFVSDRNQNIPKNSDQKVNFEDDTGFEATPEQQKDISTAIKEIQKGRDPTAVIDLLRKNGIMVNLPGVSKSQEKSPEKKLPPGHITGIRGKYDKFIVEHGPRNGGDEEITLEEARKRGYKV